MRTLKMTASAVALGAAALFAGAEQTNVLWNIDFSTTGPEAVWGTVNHTDWAVAKSGDVANGTFQKEAGADGDVDASDILAAGVAYKDGVPASADQPCLKLDTNGKDLTFVPEALDGDSTDDYSGVRAKTVISADVFFVGSDSAPTVPEDGKPVQAALYLNTPEDSGTPAIMGYVTDTEDTVGFSNKWVSVYQIPSADIDRAKGTGVWLHVEITMDGSDVTYNVAGTEVTGTRASNHSTPGLVTEVLFRGTGLVDNFTGKALEADPIVNYTYTAAVIGSAATVIDVTDHVDPVVFKIPVTGDLEGDEVNLTNIVVLAYDGTATAHPVTFTSQMEGDPGEEEEVKTWFVDGVEVVLNRNDEIEFEAPVTSWTNNATGGQVLAVYYGTESGEQPPEPAAEVTQADFEAAMAAAFADTTNAGVEFDPQDGFTVSFLAPTNGTYALKYVTSLGSDSWTQADTAEAEAGAPVELTDDLDDGNSTNARFYRVYLLQPDSVVE